MIERELSIFEVVKIVFVKYGVFKIMMSDIVEVVGVVC